MGIDNGKPAGFRSASKDDDTGNQRAFFAQNDALQDGEALLTVGHE